MDEGFGFGVGVTLTQQQAAPPPVLRPDGVLARPGRLHELLPAELLCDAELAVEIQRAERAEAMVAAYKAERVTQLAARRSAATDPGVGTPGATAARDERLDPEISEFVPDELALILNCSRTAATVLCDTAITLVRRLPATFATLADGEQDWPRARAIAGELGWKARDTPPAVIAAVETAVLPGARSLSVSGVRAAVRRELLARDSLAADARRQRAERVADVTVQPLPDGMAVLSVFCPLPVAVAMRAAVDGYARLAKEAGDPGRIGQLRVGVLTDLVLRPWDTSRPPVTAHLTVHAPLPALRPTATVGAEPAPTAEVNGEPITAGALRALLEELDALCRAGCRHRPAAACTSPSPSPPRAGCGRWSPAGSCNASPPAAARSSAHHHRWTGTGPPPGKPGSPAPGTAPAATPAAATGPSGPTSTTSCRTARAAPPTAPISAACAGDTTG